MSLYMLTHGGQRAHTSCVPSAHHPCLSLCQIPKIRFSLYITLQVSMRIVAGSVCMVFSRYAIVEYFSSQFVDRKAPSNIVQEYCYGIAVRMFYLVGGFMRQGGWGAGNTSRLIQWLSITKLPKFAIMDNYKFIR